jgi:hypothetical protein
VDEIVEYIRSINTAGHGNGGDRELA